jgi:1,4-dihydroxy-2-naphthoate polyprenyltransferase
MATLARVTALAAPARSLLGRWRIALRTGNPPAGPVDPVTRLLVMTRAAVLPMTLTAGAVAGLLTVNEPGFRPGLYALAVVGIVLAHVANNLMNDLFDLEVGTDTESYPRALYAPHPVLSGMTTRRGLAGLTLAVNVIDLGILLALFTERGWPVLAFALGGFAVSAAYTAPPLRLKKRGLGEPAVLLIWGPLMVGGTSYTATGVLDWRVLLASVPYGLLCTAVLMGKHVDKIPWDAPAGTRTLPVLLGEVPARRVTQWLMAGFYATLVLAVIVAALPWPALLALAGLPLLVKVWHRFDEPRPEPPPDDFPVWPLWFAALAFVHTRRAGALLVSGLAIAALANIH